MTDIEYDVNFKFDLWFGLRPGVGRYLTVGYLHQLSAPAGYDSMSRETTNRWPIRPPQAAPLHGVAQRLEGVAMAEVRRRLGQDVREGMGGWSGGQASRSRKLERRGRLAWPRLGLHAEWYLRADEPGRGANPQARDRAHFGAPLHTPLRGGRRVWLGRPVRQDTSEFERDSQVQAPAVNGRIERFLDLLDPFDDGIPV